MVRKATAPIGAPSWFEGDSVGHPLQQSGPEIVAWPIGFEGLPLELRERLAFDRPTQEAMLRRFAAEGTEAILLVTCNRLELYMLAEDFDQSYDGLATIAMTAGLRDPLALEPWAGRLIGRSAIQQLFAVAAGIDSTVPGESQILGQVRDAAALARKLGASGPILNRLFNRAVVVGKRARRETEIGRGTASVGSAAVGMAREILGDLSGKRALVLGRGEMGRLAARALYGFGVRDIGVATHSDRWEQLPGWPPAFRWIPWAERVQAAASVDVVISATAAREPVLTHAMLEPAIALRQGAPLALIDIAVPHDIDPTIASLPGVHLRDIHALRTLRDEGLSRRQQAIPLVSELIERETHAFLGWLRERQAVPAIQQLTSAAESVRRQELEKALARLGHLELSEREREVIAALSHGIVNKLLRGALTALKDSTLSVDGERDRELLASLFDQPKANDIE